MMQTNYVAQVGYQPQVDNTLMPKFSSWKETLKYGKIMPISVACEGFADPEFQGCGAKDGEFALGYDHEEMRKFTRRWNRVLYVMKLAEVVHRTVMNLDGWQSTRSWEMTSPGQGTIHQHVPETTLQTRM